MNALRFGLVAMAFSAARSGTMHSSMGSEMKLPSALSAWRRLRSQDWVWMFIEWSGGEFFLKGIGVIQRLRSKSDRATARMMSLTRYSFFLASASMALMPS